MPLCPLSRVSIDPMMPETDSGSIPHDTDALLSGVHPSHPHVPAVEDASGLGGSIWIVLFGGVMVLSVVANVLLAGCILSNRKKHSPIYFMMVFMFAINLVRHLQSFFGGRKCDFIVEMIPGGLRHVNLRIQPGRGAHVSLLALNVCRLPGLCQGNSDSTSCNGSRRSPLRVLGLLHLGILPFVTSPRHCNGLQQVMTTNNLST